MTGAEADPDDVEPLVRAYFEGVMRVSTMACIDEMHARRAGLHYLGVDQVQAYMAVVRALEVLNHSVRHPRDRV